MNLGYVVVCFNQASSRTTTEDCDIYNNEDEANDSANHSRRLTAAAGLRERYALGVVELLDKEPW